MEFNMADSFNINPPEYYCPPGFQKPFSDYYNYQCNYPKDVFHQVKCKEKPETPDEPITDDEDENSYRIPVLESYPWQETVISKDLLSPPHFKTKGDRYLLYSDELEGEWIGHQNEIAWYDGFKWNFDEPLSGWTLFVEDEKAYYHFSEDQWIYGLTASGNEMYFDETFKTLIVAPTLSKL